MDHAVQGIYRSTEDGHLLAANPALVAMLGYPSAEELLRTNAQQLYADPAVRRRIVARVRDA